MEEGQGCQEELFIIHTDIYECDSKTIYFSQKPWEDLGEWSWQEPERVKKSWRYRGGWIDATLLKRDFIH